MPEPYFERYIAESLERTLPPVTPREVSLPHIQNKANVVVGMRRSGKTYLLFQEMQRLIAQGIDRRNLLYVNFEDDRLMPLQVGDLDRLLESFYRQSPDARIHGAYLFLDEVQSIEGWSRFARRVLDTEKTRLFVTGSSAKMLSTEVATEFRGRGLTVEMFPFSFKESLHHAGAEVPKRLPSAPLRSRLEAQLLNYLQAGGFPEVQRCDEQTRVALLQDYVELVVARDVVERHAISNVHATRTFAKTLVQSTGRRISVNKIYNDFRSRGLSVSKDTLHALFDHFVDAYLISGVPIFSRSLRVRETNPRKIYAIDPGLAWALSHIGTSDLGVRLETAVYLELRRRRPRARDGSISYYVTQAGFEVDFVVGDPDDENAGELIQVCADLSESETRSRELRALTAAMKELGLSQARLISLFENERVETDAGVIQVTPAWLWFLDETLWHRRKPK